MTAEVELVYDRHLAAECLRSSDKYERLAAAVFGLLSNETTVHDLRLRGVSGVKHQIDVVVGPDSKRLLVECKDYDRNVGLPLVRNFYAQVEDLSPDEAFMVTTRGYSPQAQRYAEAKGIRLALLRPPKESDLDGLIQRVVLAIDATTRIQDPRIAWQVAPENWAAVAEMAGHLGPSEIDDLVLVFPDGSATGFRDLWEPIESAIPLGSDGVISGQHDFREELLLSLPGYGSLPVIGFGWEVEMSTFRAADVEVGIGIGGLVAELALLSLDGEIHRVFTNRELAEFAFTADGQLILPGG